ncbi:DNA polymerase subunit gamma-2, mitochondrial [Sebastes umbrosus]|uniref:DNA polymerase subunit gamma-2, mitochondrial n=1 Tax=Sebastes umbrosus TaxID=72105 RepID=UPI00189C9ABB|nr:DNA polymerase subunit gamma-2, mitochondrial [Sebastes umbrosus]
MSLKLLIMLSHCVRNVPSRLLCILKTSQCRITPALQQHTRRHCSASPSSEGLDEVRTLLQLCVDRYYVSPGETNTELFRCGMSCSYGPLGMELRRNLLEQWWHSVTSSTAQVFGINTLSSSSKDTATDGLGIVESEHLKHILEQQDLSKEQLIQKVQMLIQRSPSLRTNFLQGALEQFVPSLKLVNRKLPFGLAETGLCFQPSDGSGCPAEVTQTSLVWFCSPRTSSQWLDHWTRQRLKWWRKFALSPLDFSSSDVPEEELETASRGVRIVYRFPWGQEPLETLWSRGNAKLLHTHKGVRSKLQSRDGRKSDTHIVSVTGNMDRGVMAFMSNSLQQQKKEDGKQKLVQRKVLKLHPVLAPVKVALDIGRGATVELRQVCEGLLQEFMEAKISAWPGYLDTQPTSMEQLNVKYDEMGVLFTVVISENTLESGLLQVRSRDTTIRETKHVSEIKNFLSTYISAADNI